MNTPSFATSPPRPREPRLGSPRALDASRSERLGERGSVAATARTIAVTSRLRMVPGFERFRGWFEADEVAEAAGAELLVYLLPGPTAAGSSGTTRTPGGSTSGCRCVETTRSRRRYGASAASSAPPPSQRSPPAGGERDHRLAVGRRLRAPAAFIADRPCHVVAHGYLAGLPIHAARPRRDPLTGRCTSATSATCPRRGR